MIKAVPTVWVLADDQPGNAAQCMGVAEALGFPFVTKTIRYTRWAMLPNWALGPSLRGVRADSRAELAAPWPDLVIAAGRRTAPVARWIGRRSGARLVQVMDPGPGGRGDFALIAVPGHDDTPPKGANVMVTSGAPHRVTPERLRAAAAQWLPRLEHLPRPWVAVLVGGDTGRRRFTAAMARELGHLAGGLADGGSVLATTSRRTSAEAEAALIEALPAQGFVHRWRDGGDNPYFGFLALADAVVVTGDSVSMACEACAVGVPVHVYAPAGWVVSKHARLHADLFRSGHAQLLAAGRGLGRATGGPPLNVAATIAAAIREL